MYKAWELKETELTQDQEAYKRMMEDNEERHNKADSMKAVVKGNEIKV